MERFISEEQSKRQCSLCLFYSFHHQSDNNKNTPLFVQSINFNIPSLLLSPFTTSSSSSFIWAFILSPASTYKLTFLGLKTCPVSPYLEWLGVVVKAEEHGSVRCRVLNGSNDSFPFVLGRYTIQRLLLY